MKLKRFTAFLFFGSFSLLKYSAASTSKATSATSANAGAAGSATNAIRAIKGVSANHASLAIGGIIFVLLTSLNSHKGKRKRRPFYTLDNPYKKSSSLKRLVFSYFHCIPPLQNFGFLGFFKLMYLGLNCQRTNKKSYLYITFFIFSVNRIFYFLRQF